MRNTTRNSYRNTRETPTDTLGNKHCRNTSDKLFKTVHDTLKDTLHNTLYRHKTETFKNHYTKSLGTQQKHSRNSTEHITETL